MNTNYYDMIFKRKSFHFFLNAGKELISEQELEDIKDSLNSLTPLHPEIKTAFRILSHKEYSCKRGEEYSIFFYSEKKDGYLQNIGYIGEQLDLALVSKNIGTLWYGIGRPDLAQYEGLDYVIMMAIRKVDNPSKFRDDMFKSKRKEIEEIWNGEQLLDIPNIVRFAPSACNLQTWLIKREDNILNVFRYKDPEKRGIMPRGLVSFYNRIDMGIFLLFLEICLDHSGVVYQRELFPDDGTQELTLNAKYQIKPY